jgi:hypothetical protein
VRTAPTRKKSVFNPSDNVFMLFYDAEPAVLCLYYQIRHDKMIVTDGSAYRSEEVPVFYVKVAVQIF